MRVGEGAKASSPPSPTKQNIDHLLVDDVPKEITVKGVTFQVREADGEYVMKLIDKCTRGDPMRPETLRLDRGEYLSALIEHCVVSPKLPRGRIKPGVYTELGTEIEKFLGLGEVAQKNLSEMSNEK